MDHFAALLTAVAAVVGAVAWPGTIFILLFLFRTELKSILSKVPAVLDKVKKASFPGIAVELDRIAAEVASDADESGKITQRQVEVATRIEIQTREIGSQALLHELDRLCLEYDTLRRSLPPGRNRTRSMTQVLVKMRSLAPSLIDSLNAYKISSSAGSRLAAIAMMQMAPQEADLDWLKDRFSCEQPFVFYHAALALQNVANIADTAEKKGRLRMVAEQALHTLKKFLGTPDPGTVHVLQMLLSSLSQTAARRAD